ncbi:hypothetical protein M5D96_002743 [Drosophila gunungcola]|uniref:Uncharacterized protein n=1 Tax=Drosophila gunungcola TaxID=103775 RepID=A0A9Q0BVS8_9MUSC|nr:hypothetical protein M5D96_002743 [Drosophila gunungcola]
MNRLVDGLAVSSLHGYLHGHRLLLLGHGLRRKLHQLGTQLQLAVLQLNGLTATQQVGDVSQQSVGRRHRGGYL